MPNWKPIDLNWNFLRYFCSVAEHKSIKLAAEDIDVASSSISEGLASLERTLNCRLLSRTTRRIELTAQGRALFNRVKPIFDSQLQILESVNCVNASLQLVSLGIVPSESFPSSFKFINHLLDFPYAEAYSVRSCDSVQLERYLEDGEIDFGLSNRPLRSKNVGCKKISSNRISYFVHKDFENIPMRDLLTQLKVGLLGGADENINAQRAIEAAYPEISIRYLLTDYPSLLLNSCQEKKAMVGYASGTLELVGEDLCEILDPTLHSTQSISEQYLVWAKRLEGSTLFDYLMETFRNQKFFLPTSNPIEIEGS